MDVATVVALSVSVSVANVVDAASLEARLRSRQDMAVGMAVVMGAAVVHHKKAGDVTVDVVAGSRYVGSLGSHDNGGCSGSRHRGGSTEVAFIKS